MILDSNTILGWWFNSNLWRTTSEEKREMERLEKPIYNSIRQAAEVHRQVFDNWLIV